jgi:hypothetical protein
MMCHPPWLGECIQDGRAVLPKRDPPSTGRVTLSGYNYGLVQGQGAHSRLGLRYSAANVREAKCTRLGYGIRLSRLHNLDPH